MEDYIAGYSEDEWKKLKTEFERDFAMLTKYNKSFPELIRGILEKETQTGFADKTQLSQNQLYRLRNCVDEQDPPRRSTLMTVCVAYNLDMMMAQTLLHSLGLDFSRKRKRDFAYAFLLTRCRGKSIDECNEILENLGIEEKDWLGIHARNKISK